jgi:hypothetical protein
MKLIVYYVAISMLGNVIAAVICLGIEKIAPAISMPIFLALFFVILWGAWVLAVRWTDPDAERASAADATSKMKA